jgi:hypothetical protein
MDSYPGIQIPRQVHIRYFFQLTTSANKALMGEIMKTKQLKYQAHKIVVDSDIKLNLTISADTTLDCHSLDCMYPEADITFTEDARDGVVHILIKNDSKSLSAAFTKEWGLNLTLSSSLTELLLNAANTSADFRNGTISDIRCNFATCSLVIHADFNFKVARLDSAKGDYKIAVPECFEKLAINTAIGKIALTLPATTYIKCSQKRLMKCKEQIFGQPGADDAAPKIIDVQGALVSTNITNN